MAEPLAQAGGNADRCNPFRLQGAAQLGQRAGIVRNMLEDFPTDDHIEFPVLERQGRGASLQQNGCYWEWAAWVGPPAEFLAIDVAGGDPIVRAGRVRRPGRPGRRRNRVCGSPGSGPGASGSRWRHGRDRRNRRARYAWSEDSEMENSRCGFRKPRDWLRLMTRREIRSLRANTPKWSSRISMMQW